MRQSERQRQILQHLMEQGSLPVADLARRLGVSLETIRRDVRPLVEQGDVDKRHGSVALAPRRGEAPFERRMRENAAAKQAIAATVAAMVADGDSIMLDTGTTTSYVARALLSKRGLTVVTNSSDVARTLAIANGNTVYMAGGQLRGDNGAAFGAAAVAFIRSFRVRHAVISIGAVDAGQGFMNFDLAEAELGREILSRGENRIIATDASKFGRSALVKVCDVGDLDVLVTDGRPPPSLSRELEEAGVRVALPS